MVEPAAAGVPPQQDEIIAEELARASENIERRVKRREHTFTLATGPEDGEYARFGAALIDGGQRGCPRRQAAPAALAKAASTTPGCSSRGEADYAIVQGDVAAAAFAGDDVFARGGALGEPAGRRRPVPGGDPRRGAAGLADSRRRSNSAGAASPSARRRPARASTPWRCLPRMG